MQLGPTLGVATAALSVSIKGALISSPRRKLQYAAEQRENTFNVEFPFEHSTAVGAVERKEDATRLSKNLQSIFQIGHLCQQSETCHCLQPGAENDSEVTLGFNGRVVRDISDWPWASQGQWRYTH